MSQYSSANVPVAESKSGARNTPPTPSNSPPHTEANKKRAITSR
jgi:hypothetical protein